MTTERKRQIAIENGKKSRGPKTPEGKAISSRNGLKHGFTARRFTAHFEPDPVHAEILRALEAEFQPCTQLEYQLIASIADAHWRTKQIRTREESLFNQPAFDLQTVADNSGVLFYIDRLENRYNRLYHRAIRQLLGLREAENAKANQLTATKQKTVKKTNPRSPSHAATPIGG